MDKIKLPTLGVATSIGGSSDSCAKGPIVLKKSKYAVDYLNWKPFLEVSNKNKNSLNMLKKQNCVIAQFTQEQLEENKPFIVLGGDHSIAAGSWAGVMNQLPANSTFALIWIDAHMDAHTLQTSPSGNLHGMPVSLLLGEAEHELLNCFPSENYISGRDLYMFGIRSYEAEEVVLLSKKNVNVFDTKRIADEGGVEKVLAELIHSIAEYYDYFAISLDLDAMDPADAPGVETRAEAGLKSRDVLNVFKGIDFNDKFIGLEISEFDPDKDIDNKTEKLVFDLIDSVFLKFT